MIGRGFGQLVEHRRDRDRDRPQREFGQGSVGSSEWDAGQLDVEGRRAEGAGLEDDQRLRLADLGDQRRRWLHPSHLHDGSVDQDSVARLMGDGDLDLDGVADGQDAVGHDGHADLGFFGGGDRDAAERGEGDHQDDQPGNAGANHCLLRR